MDDTAKHTLHAWWRSSPLAVLNAPYLEELYERYLRDPAAIDPVWRRYFETLPGAGPGAPDVSHDEIRARFRELVRARRAVARVAQPVGPSPELAQKQVRVLQLINAYRFRGHQIANLDPLGLREEQTPGELDLHYHGLTDFDLDLRFDTGSLVGPRQATLRDILAQLQSTYCGSIGAEYMHITDTAEKRWLQSALESVHGVPPYPAETRRRLLERLTAAEGLEHYLHARYVGQKRFSLEGSESLIPMLDEVIQRAGDSGVKEIVIGMAHRGRLNVLVNILGKTPAELFLEFEGKARSLTGSGDVKYHKGFSSDIDTPGGPVHLALAFNPSHLEIVGPVVQGSVRARQERRRDKRGARVLPVVIHGDAAFAGQGVIMETFNLSQLRGYRTGGTVHIVVNNQIGFTTSLTQDARSTLYCTDIARMVNAPILHVNGDDPEAVLFATEIGLDYRTNFRKDIVIDLVCYRRHGHSEADEPTVTQPVMYQRIRELPTTRARYARHLSDAGILTAEESDAMVQQFRERLDAGDAVAPNLVPKEKSGYSFGTDWSRFDREAVDSVDTSVALDTLRALTDRLLMVPEGFELHPSVAKVDDARRKMAAGALPIDWGFAETLAYATLLRQGYAVRLSGQDSGRGTFFHRHAIVHSRKDGEVFVPLRNLFEGQPDFRVINSPLTEEACLAFEYGYSTADPSTLDIWEAQFGDFANNAQVVIDQFISGGEQKWGRLCGLTLLLPHGLEGQGPEHSSARLERYLQLCAQQNMFVCVPTTPAQFFHLLRRQMLMRTRKPLIVMTPKSLLRHRLAVSSLEDLTGGTFLTVVPEVDAIEPASVTDVVMCGGKVYYDLIERRRERGANQVAILRIEQLYPFPEALLVTELARYPNARRFVWCQEEHQNQGAWFPSQHHVWRSLPPGARLEYAGRPMSAAPAVGDYQLHLQELREVVNSALGTPGDEGQQA